MRPFFFLYPQLTNLLLILSERISIVRCVMNNRIQSPLPTTPDLRVYLQQEFLRRCRVNPRYSLRAFARYLKLESSYLSKILQGKREITVRLLTRVQGPLAITPPQADLFTERIRQLKKKKEKPELLLNLEQVSVDVFHVIADWYHFAILELSQLTGFRADADWIGEKLDIAPITAKDALDRLGRLNLLQETGDTWTIRHLTTVGGAPTAEAFRALQIGVLEKAIEAVKTIPPEQRDQSSITVATHSSMLPEIKDRMRKFRRELSVALTKAPRKDVVLNMSFSAYPVARVDVLPTPTVRISG